MKPSLGILFLTASLAFTAQARATVLPDACGDDKVKFDVKTETSKNPPAPPTDGKAQIVFIENENHMVGPFMYATVRFGMDGAWVGANNNNSYFTLDVTPGVHHLCASWQSALKRIEKNVDVASFTAEPGKVYYFAADVKVIPTGENTADITFGISQLDEDKGKYRVKAWKLATWKSK
ncbi:MAG: hypothetical protein ABR990_05610 [Terracidiphilus sp.]|jgi:hypothetical protein